MHPAKLTAVFKKVPEGYIAFVGQMAHRIHKPFEVHGPEAPLTLQNHDATVRFRNIWIRPLKGYDAK